MCSQSFSFGVGHGGCFALSAGVSGRVPDAEYCCPATFSTFAEAQRAADAHQLDYYPDAQTIDDGFHWLLDPEIDWCSLPDAVRARREILASLSRP
jgi:hypothetical protein